MFSIILLTFLVTSPLLYVQAQSAAASSSAAIPSSINQIPPCVLNCTSTAATQAGCSSVTDTACVCTSQKFQAQALSCLQSSCSPSDQASAMALQGTICGTQSPAITPSASATAPPMASASPTAQATGAASGLYAGLATGYVSGLVAVLVGPLLYFM